MNKLLLKTLAGSRAYGLETPESDYDYHAVFITPTSELLALGNTPKGQTWDESKDVDLQTWELGRFLFLATRCNPTILETFVAPIVDDEKNPDLLQAFQRITSEELRALLPHVLTRRRVRDAFRGYAHNQRTKLFKDPDSDFGAPQISDRTWKFSTQYIRVLIQGEHLLRTGELVIDAGLYPDMIHYPGGRASVRPLLMDIRRGRFNLGDVINIASRLEEQLEKAYTGSEIPDEPNLEPVNDFLLRMRKGFWN